jgi:hypothetical protein
MAQFMRKCRNMWEIQGSQMTSQLGACALCAGLARLYARIRMHIPTRPDNHMHARTRKRAHMDQYVILIAFPQQQWFRERASLLRYTYVACAVTVTVDIQSFMGFLNIAWDRDRWRAVVNSVMKFRVCYHKMRVIY